MKRAARVESAPFHQPKPPCSVLRTRKFPSARTVSVRPPAWADYRVPELGLVVDIKTTLDASPDEFRRSIARYGYHAQDAMYRQGYAANDVEVDHFLFVAVEKAPPYGVAVYALDDDARGRGNARIREGIDLMSWCVRNDRWPGYSDSIEEIQLPPWAA